MKRRNKRNLSIITVIAILFSLFSPVANLNVKAETVVATDLLISEYIEGSGFNKVIELYNGTGSDLDLSQYSLGIHTNGAEEVSQKLTLSGTLKNSKASNSADQMVRNGGYFQPGLNKCQSFIVYTIKSSKKQQKHDPSLFSIPTQNYRVSGELYLQNTKSIIHMC